MQPLERFIATLQKKERTLIGLMSGMSMDGIDIAMVRVAGSYPTLDIDLLETDYVPYPSHLRQRLLAARQGSAEHVCILNVAVAEAFASAVNQFLKTHHIARERIDAIGSHGQTLVHVPPTEHPGSTLQIGSPSVIAHHTGITTIGNFRHRDMAANGHGAPLVPLADYLMFKAEPKPLALHNLGNISNVTVLGETRASLYAFDTGPANHWIDTLAARIPENNTAIDFDGRYSSQGHVRTAVLEYWLSHPFFKQAPPKSAGYTSWGTMLDIPSFESYALVDLLRTAVELSAQTITEAYRCFVLPKTPALKRVLVSGGGVHNPTLMTRLKSLLATLDLEVTIHPDPRMTDAKEAMAFAILANETLSGRPGTISAATGAHTEVICGEIAMA